MLLFVAMMVHVHGVDAAWLRLILLVVALWHVLASVHVVLGDYPIPQRVRMGVVVVGTVLAVASVGVFSWTAVAAYRDPSSTGITDTEDVRSADVAPTLARCAECHGDTSGDPPRFRAWAAEAPVRERIAEGHNVTPAEAGPLQRWIEAGMPGED